MNNARRVCLEQEMHTIREKQPRYMVSVISFKCSCRSISGTCRQFLTDVAIYLLIPIRAHV